MTKTPRARPRWQTALVLTAAAVALTGCTGGNGDVERQNHLGFSSGVAPSGDGLSTGEALGLFVIGPLLILLVVAALVWLPGMVRGNRYRPAKGWSASPLWFGGPPDPAAAVESAQTGELVRGGASGSW